tara:strand:- start:21665 stop:22171 length:507 start_codon:yes stop_codon:yes gene_type:complete
MVNFKNNSIMSWFRGPRGQRSLLVLFGIGVIVYMIPQEDLIKGSAIATGGTGFRIEQHQIALYGVKSLPAKLECKRNASKVNCMKGTTSELSSQLHSREVICDNIKSTNQSLVYARCSSEGLDLAYHLVKSGWATADISLTDEYLAQEIEARKRQKGFWATYSTKNLE